MDAYVRNTATGLLFWTRIRTVSSDGIVRLTRTISLQRGVGGVVGGLDGVGVAVGVSVCVGVSVSVAGGVAEGTGVSENGGEAVAVNVRESVEGRPTTRAVRN